MSGSHPTTPVEIFEIVREIIADALGRDPKNVKLTSTIFKDLGGESIDLLDIFFRIEKSIGVRISRGDDFPNLESERLSFSDPLTPTALDAISEKMPYIGIKNMKLKQGATFEDLLTVEFCCKIVAHKLEVPWS